MLNKNDETKRKKSMERQAEQLWCFHETDRVCNLIIT